MLDTVPSAESQRIAGQIEEVGFRTLWIPEAVGRDPFVTATLLLSATSTLHVATGIANVYARDAMTMASFMADRLAAFAKVNTTVSGHRRLRPSRRGRLASYVRCSLGR